MNNNSCIVIIIIAIALEEKERSMKKGASNNSGGGLREELIGHATLAVLGVLGLALYSLTYSLVYAGSSSTPVVAVLEMWMVTVHLASPLTCGLLQSLFSNSFTAIKHVAAAQTSVFLGVACTVTIAGVGCLRSGNHGATCTAYFGAAAFPKFAAAGSIAWAWVMYASSLGCQFSSITLGLSSKNSLTVATIVLLVPYFVASKLGDTCGGATWTVPLCNNACGVGGPIVVAIMSLALSHAGALLLSLRQTTVGAIASLLGDLVMILGCFFLWLAQNAHDASAAHHITCVAISLFSFISSIRRMSAKKNPPNTLFCLTKNSTCLSLLPQKARAPHFRIRNSFDALSTLSGEILNFGFNFNFQRLVFTKNPM